MSYLEANEGKKLIGCLSSASYLPTVMQPWLCDTAAALEARRGKALVMKMCPPVNSINPVWG